MSHVWCLAITSQLLIEINSVASTHTILHLSNTQHHRHIIILLNSIINSIFRLKRGSHRNSVLIWRHMQPDWPHWQQHLSRCTIKLADDISYTFFGWTIFFYLFVINKWVCFFFYFKSSLILLKYQCSMTMFSTQSSSHMWYSFKFDSF